MKKTSFFIIKFLIVIISLLLLTECKTKISGENDKNSVNSDGLVNSPPIPMDGEGIHGRINSKWLPNTTENQPLSPDVDNFLKDVHGSMRLLYCQYKGAQLIQHRQFSPSGLKTDQEHWLTTVETNPVSSDPSAMDLSIQVKLKSGDAKESGLAVAFDFSDWTTENYVMLPASVYNGNRLKIVDRAYAEGLDRKYLYQKDIPLMSVPIPHLAFEKDSVSRLEVNASYLATPAMCFYSKEKKRGFILLAEQKSHFSNNGFIVEESEDRNGASFVVTAPGVIEKKPLFVGFTESKDKGINLKAGDKIEMKLRLYSFKANDIPALLEKFMEVRKSLTGPNNPRNLIPFSQVTHWMTERIDERWYDGEDFQFYRPENANWISFGWIGGLMNTFPMLALGDEKHLDRVSKTFDFAIPRAQGKSGYFYGALNFDGKPFGREGYDDFPEIVLTRKNSDVLFWMIKQFMLLKAQGKDESIKEDWEKNIKHLADAFVKTWEDYGTWGNFLNNNTGEVAVYNTTSGAQAPGGLALASVYFNQPKYLDIAVKAANYYYDNDFTLTGQTTAHSADILQNADADSAYALAQSLMTLYEITGDDVWLEKARQVCNLFATWTTSYDYELPPETELSKNGAKLAGIIFASTQNKHGAPGECTSSSDVLFKIYRNNGDARYAELLKDIIGAYGESIRPGGYTNERLTYCDAEPFSIGNRGEHVTGWNELAGILMAMELPGIYLQTDNDRFVVFDQMEAKVVKRDENGIILNINNPTKFDANISILAETEKNAQKPLGYASFINWPKVIVMAEQSIQVTVGMDGKVNLN